MLPESSHQRLARCARTHPGWLVNLKTQPQVHSLASPDCLLPLGLVLTLPRLIGAHPASPHRCSPCLAFNRLSPSTNPCILHQMTTLVVNNEVQGS